MDKYIGIALYGLLYWFGGLMYFAATARVYLVDLDAISDQGLLLLVLIGVVAFTFIRCSRGKIVALVICFALAASGFVLAPLVRHVAEQLFLESREAELDSLVGELEAVDTLGEIPMIMRRPEDRVVTPSRFLQLTGMDRPEYLRLSREIRLVGFHLAELKPNWIAFYRGFFDRGLFDDAACGLIYVTPGKPLPNLGDRMAIGELYVVRRVKGNWYYFETTERTS